MDAAFKVFELIEERKMKPNVFTYSVLINGLTKRGELSRAMALLEQMRSNGVRPSLVTFATLLKSCSRLYDAHIMRDIIERMQADLKVCTSSQSITRCKSIWKRLRSLSKRLVLQLASHSNSLTTAARARSDEGLERALPTGKTSTQPPR